jgi:hypothetical protein
MNIPPAPDQPEAGHRRRNQIVTAVLLAAVIALVFLLATSVGGLELLPGEAFALPRMITPQFGGGTADGFDFVLVIFRIVMALALIALPFYIILSILTKEGRQRLLRNLITIGVLYLILTALRNIRPGDPLQPDNGMTMEMPKMGEAGATTPLPEFNPNPSDATVLAITLAVSLLIVGLIAVTIWVIVRRRQEAPTAMQSLADEAQQAIDTIQAGGSLEDAITRCYREMCSVLQRERGIERGNAMTPSEFETVLLGKGMPRQAVHQLTRLFEDIRYGSKPAGAREEQLAIESLTAIAAACRPQGARA